MIPTPRSLPFTLPTPRSLALTALAVGALTTAAAPAARAISMRDDVPNVASTGNDNPYVALGATFSAVAFIQIDLGNNMVGNASGTLVNSSVPGQFKFLTAAHNVDNTGGGAGGTRPNGVADNASYNVYFGARTDSNGDTATSSVVVPASAVSIQPLWVSGDGTLGPSGARYDMAVFTFTLTSVVGAALPTPYGFSLANPTGMLGTTVGYGSFGTGNNFANNSSDGVRRAGRNVVDVLGNPPDNSANTGFTLQTDFDAPNGTTSTLGAATPLTLEASTAGGDSGGPLLVDANGNPVIVGVLNGGFNPTGSMKVSEYGDRSIWAPVSDASNLQFLAANGIAVPEPATYALVALGLAALGGYVGRRRGA